MMKHNEKGYALLELLLVVVLLGILTSMAVPRFITSRDETRLRQCQHNIHAINNEIEEYYFMTGALPTNADYNTIVNDTARFPDGPPHCDAGGIYTINDRHRAECSIHGTL